MEFWSKEGFEPERNQWIVLKKRGEGSHGKPRAHHWKCGYCFQALFEGLIQRPTCGPTAMDYQPTGISSKSGKSNAWTAQAYKGGTYMGKYEAPFFHASKCQGIEALQKKAGLPIKDLEEKLMYFLEHYMAWEDELASCKKLLWKAQPMLVKAAKEEEGQLLRIPAAGTMQEIQALRSYVQELHRENKELRNIERQKDAETINLTAKVHDLEFKLAMRSDADGIEVFPPSEDGVEEFPSSEGAFAEGESVGDNFFLVPTLPGRV